jgi:lipooligosaccharide transport system permease protein
MILLNWRRGIMPIYQKVIRQESQGWFSELVTTMATPLTFFLAFGLGLRGYIQEIDGMSYMAFMAPGLISLTILNEAYRTGAWGLWLDRWHQKMLDEFRIKPITTSDIIIGQILGGFTIALIKGTVVGLVLSLLAGLHLNGWHIGQFLMYLFPGSIIFTCVGTCVGTLFRKPDQIAQIQTVVITPLLYLGGLFFPLSALPQWVQDISYWLPTTILFQGGRTALLNGHTMGPLDGVILWAAAAMTFAIATSLFNHKLSE